jgi:hypothetical protein
MTRCGLLATMLCVLSASGLSAQADTGSRADTENDAASANVATSYDSNYNYRNKAGNATSFGTPEDDARPGEYYFKLGANAFERKDYAHAAEMYKVAASWAEKTAEYNLAVMYARGQGVPVDLPRAMAWSALAAERGDSQYVETREVIYSNLSKEQFEQANGIWRELRKTYGDEVALARAKARWREVRANATGSLVGSIGNLQVGASGGMTFKSRLADPVQGSPLNPVATTASDLLNGNQEAGSIAYRQLRESDNPYDPKFVRPPLGIATVQPLIPVANDGSVGTPKAKTPEDGKHNF